ncbi:MAG: hypothetical protein IKP65_05005, partial [Alphaproteobacteria bacterium]|nr:hypothetical protein [Alphaproteobacteria bacterium]
SDKFLKGQEKLRSLVGTPVSSSDPTIGVGYRPLYSEDIYDVDPRERALLFFNKILELEKELKIKKDNLVIVYNAEKKLVLEKELVFIKKVMEDFEAGKISFPIRHSFSLFDQIYYKTFDSYEDIKKADTMISRDLKKYKIFNTSETSLASIREIRSKMENEILKIKKSLESKRREVEPDLYLIGKCIEDTYNS